MPRHRMAVGLAAIFLGAALTYFVAPFSLRLDGSSTYVGTPEDFQNRIRADCAAPWRQLVDPPSSTLRTGNPGGFDIVHGNLQPLCRDTGRSRARFSAWLLAAAIALLSLARPWRLGRDWKTETVLIDAT